MERFPTNKKHSLWCRVHVLGTGPQLAANTYSRKAGVRVRALSRLIVLSRALCVPLARLEVGELQAGTEGGQYHLTSDSAQLI